MITSEGKQEELTLALIELLINAAQENAKPESERESHEFEAHA